MAVRELNEQCIDSFINLVSHQCNVFKQLPANKQRLEARKFLFARKSRVEQAARVYMANQRLRVTEGLHDIDPRCEPVRQELLSGKFTIWSHPECYNGALIAIFTARLHHPGVVNERDTLRALVLQLDAAMESEAAQRSSVIFVYDMTRAKYEHFDYHLSTRIVNMMQGCYPAHLGRVFIVAPPLWFRAPLRMLRVFLREKLRQRIVTVTNRTELLRVHFKNDSHQHIGPLTQEMGAAQSMELHRQWLRSVVLKEWMSKLDSSYFTEDGNVPIKTAEPMSTVNGTSSNSSTSTFTDLFRRRSSSASTSDATHKETSSEDETKLHSLSSKKSISPSPSQQPGQWSNYLRVSGPSLHEVNDPLAETLSDFRLRMQDPNIMATLYREFKTEIQARESKSLSEVDISSFRKTSNSMRNRYSDVRCLEWTRVPLHLTTDNDYIHANWVDGYRQKDAFICCQGPLPNTVTDFWAMVWEYSVPVIVMTTKALEQRKVKCHTYWPQKPDSESDVMSVCNGVVLIVRNERVEEGQYFITTHLTIRNMATDESRRVVHLYFTAWPDHAAPPSIDSFLSLLYAYRKHYSDALQTIGYHFSHEGAPVPTSQGDCDHDIPCSSVAPPTLVHCSAGIGRTGTFVAMDILTKRLEHAGMVNVKNCVQLIRSQRHGSVQTPQQYFFLHIALLDYAVRKNLLQSQTAEES